MTQELSNPSLIPYLIGVTGHRDLRTQDIVPLELAVQSVIEDLRKRLPSTPVILLSGLAAGADQLAARVALRCGVSLAAVLPMPDAIYKTTMDKKGRECFDRLLPRASLTIRLPLAAGVTDELLAESEKARAGQYEALAVFLATYCQAVIALWNGEASDAEGGTYRVIQYVLGNPPESEGAWGDPQSGVVYRIVTPRESKSAVAGDMFEVQALTSLDPTEQANADEHRALERSLERFNRDAMGISRAHSNPLGGLIGEECGAAPTSFMCRVGTVYETADALSVHFSKQTRSTLLWILGFALTAIGGFEVYAHVFRTHFALWLVYPVSLVGAWTVYRLTRDRRIETRYLDYRALAEALRVQFFWKLAGIRESVAEHYLVHHRTELDWIRYAIRAIWLFQDAEPDGVSGGERAIRLVLEHWIRDQKNFYGKTSKKQKKALERLKSWSGGSLWSVWLFSLCIPVSLLIPWEGLVAWRRFASEEPWLGVLILLTSVPSITIGILRVWMEHGGYEEQVRTYSRMADVFHRAERRLEKDLGRKDASSVEAGIKDVRELIHRLGIQALEENGDWLLLHRDRPIEIVGH
jgi:hypothetical protein